jgi:hypothetical protein
LVAKNVVLTSHKDITPVLCNIVRLSKQIESVDLLKVLNFKDKTTSLVVVPCSPKQSGFKKHWILQCARRQHKEEESVDDDVDNGKMAHTNGDTRQDG